jgi:hypothetical protein
MKEYYCRLPMWFKLWWAKKFIHMFRLESLQDDIVLFNELRLWIETKGRPTTSNTNYWINGGGNYGKD